MPWSWLIAVAIGLVSGSFLNMLIYRVSSKVSLFKPPFSICPLCKHRLGPLDLLPVISFLALKGRCRYCRQKIDPGYLLVELLAVLTAVLLMTAQGFGFEFVLNYLIYLLLIGAAVSDIKTGEIEYIFSIGPLLLAIFSRGISFSAAFASVAVFIVFFAVAYFGQKIYKREVFGGADIILLAVGAYFFEPQKMLLFLYIPFVVGAIWGIGIILSKKQKIMAFAPFIVLSFFITDVVGWRIVNWYLSLF